MPWRCGWRKKTWQDRNDPSPMPYIPVVRGNIWLAHTTHGVHSLLGSANCRWSLAARKSGKSSFGTPGTGFVVVGKGQGLAIFGSANCPFEPSIGSQPSFVRGDELHLRGPRMVASNSSMDLRVGSRPNCVAISQLVRLDLESFNFTRPHASFHENEPWLQQFTRKPTWSPTQLPYITINGFPSLILSFALVHVLLPIARQLLVALSSLSSLSSPRLPVHRLVLLLSLRSLTRVLRV